MLSVRSGRVCIAGVEIIWVVGRRRVGGNCCPRWVEATDHPRWVENAGNPRWVGECVVSWVEKCLASWVEVAVVPAGRCRGLHEPGCPLRDGNVLAADGRH